MATVRRRMGPEHRRKVRVLEAKRDSLMDKKRKAAIELAATRAQLKQLRTNRG